MPDTKQNKGTTKTKQDTEKTVHDLTKREDLTQVLDQSLHALQEMEQRLQMLEQELGRIGNRQTPNPQQSLTGAGIQSGLGGQQAQGAIPNAQGTSAIGAPHAIYPPTGAHPASLQSSQVASPYGAQGRPPTVNAAFAQIPQAGISPWPANFPMYQSASSPSGVLPAAGAGGPVSETMQLGQQGEIARGGANESPSEINPSVREPNMDVVDLAKEFCIHWELPGVKKEDVDIMVTDKSVILNAKGSPDNKDGVVVHTERPPTVYRRTVPFETEVDTSSAKASLKDGILTVNIPKRTPSSGPKHLDVAYG